MDDGDAVRLVVQVPQPGAVVPGRLVGGGFARLPGDGPVLTTQHNTTQHHDQFVTRPAQLLDHAAVGGAHAQHAVAVQREVGTAVAAVVGVPQPAPVLAVEHVPAVAAGGQYRAAVVRGEGRPLQRLAAPQCRSARRGSGRRRVVRSRTYLPDGGAGVVEQRDASLVVDYEPLRARAGRARPPHRSAAQVADDELAVLGQVGPAVARPPGVRRPDGAVLGVVVAFLVPVVLVHEGVRARDRGERLVPQPSAQPPPRAAVHVRPGRGRRSGQVAHVVPPDHRAVGIGQAQLTGLAVAVREDAPAEHGAGLPVHPLDQRGGQRVTPAVAPRAHAGHQGAIRDAGHDMTPRAPYTLLVTVAGDGGHGSRLAQRGRLGRAGTGDKQPNAPAVQKYEVAVDGDDQRIGAGRREVGPPRALAGLGLLDLDRPALAEDQRSRRPGPPPALAGGLVRQGRDALGVVPQQEPARRGAQRFALVEPVEHNQFLHRSTYG